MADWVRCSSVDETDKVLWVNLDQVVSLEKGYTGTEITYAGGKNPLVVSDSPANILGHNVVRDA